MGDIRINNENERGLKATSGGRTVHFTVTIVLIFLLTLVPSLVYGQSSPPPVGAPLVREGDFAISLVQSLGLGSASDEVEAESLLGGVGIAPRNGWIADYPVTPDIVGELEAAVSDAADAGRIPLTRDEALQRFAEVNAQMGLAVAPYTGSEAGAAGSPGEYPNPGVESDYYATEGPPVVTYYAPPPDFYYLYTWIPYPFTCSGFFFPGFFVLHDFHRTVFIHHRPFLVTNHFNDVDRRRVFRIDPDKRFTGKTFAGIGAPASRGFISSEGPGASRSVFNAPQAHMVPRSSTNSSGTVFNAPPVQIVPRGPTTRPGTVFNAPHIQIVPRGPMNSLGGGRWPGNEGGFGSHGSTGSAFAGTGPPRSEGFRSPQMPGAGWRAFNGAHDRMTPEGRTNQYGFGNSGGHEQGFGGRGFVGHGMGGSFSHGGAFRG